MGWDPALLMELSHNPLDSKERFLTTFVTVISSQPQVFKQKSVLVCMYIDVYCPYLAAADPTPASSEGGRGRILETGGREVYVHLKTKGTFVSFSHTKCVT